MSEGPSNPPSNASHIVSSNASCDSGMLLVISGPSGVGKTTICRAVCERLDVARSISVTTRPRAATDVDGEDYHFLTRARFEKLRAAGELLEWAEVFGNCYGTPRQPVEQAIAAGRLVLLEIDVQGAVQIRKAMPDALAIFILPPTEDALLQRLRSRGREDEAVIQRRFQKARQEIAAARDSGVYDHFVTNDDLDAAIEKTVSLVQQTWRQRRGGPSE
jgi:guanylate kinase